MRRFLLAATLLLLAGAAQAQSPPLGLPAEGNSGYPPGAIPITAVATGTTGAVTASLVPPSSQFSYICGFSVSWTEGATAGGPGPVAVTNLVGLHQFTFQVTTITSAASEFSKTFTPCVPTSGAGGFISVQATANANATAVDVNVWGYVR